MLLDHGRHVIMMDTKRPQFKMDFLFVGGLIKTYHTDLGYRIKLQNIDGFTYILLGEQCDELRWNLITNEIKKWSELKKRVIFEEKWKGGA